MTEFFKAAARCDITVLRKSPVPLNEKQIMEEELASRQWETVQEKADMEKELKQQIKECELELFRQRDQESRMKQLRIEEKRKEAIRHKEMDRESKQESERVRGEQAELHRLAAVEERRQQMVDERNAAKAKAAEKAYEEVQHRLKRGLQGPDPPPPPAPETEGDLSYMEKLRIENQRLQRVEALYPGQGIGAFYPDAKPASLKRCQLERDIMASREAERLRLQQEKEEISRLEDSAYHEDAVKKASVKSKQKEEHEAWLKQVADEEAEEAKRKEELRLIELKKQEKHPLDKMREQSRVEFMKEQEAQSVLEDNLRDGVSHFERLEQFMSAEADAFREQRQLESELIHESDILESTA
eukprot:NODE_502_length_1426_cov_55.371824_g468_i0.p1 GENE.NODE_502_length_1426_cov_55.371824_g468_i0~~NODE_502_length_1426_cov_55.371824_g468_i0.p1  ORF type:complete len:357 (-),score=83.83 NODE_502_length_1426_cov_55.371824_g468_i0:180-1250(-)